MTQKDIVTESVFNSQFNFADFQKDALLKFKAGHTFTGKDGILTPFIKHIVNATLDCEMDQHLEECNNKGEANRRNGKLSKNLSSG